MVMADTAQTWMMSLLTCLLAACLGVGVWGVVEGEASQGGEASRQASEAF